MRAVLGLLAVLSLALTGCQSSRPETTSNAPASSPAASTGPVKVTNPRFPPPDQGKSRGRNFVTIDPCAISDDLIRNAGFDPATRRREDYLGFRIFLRCTFERGDPAEFSMSVEETHVTLPEMRVRHPKHIDTQINGREAIRVDNVDGGPGSSLYYMKSPDGVFGVSIEDGASTDITAGPRMLESVAKAVEPFLEGK